MSLIPSCRPWDAAGSIFPLQTLPFPLSLTFLLSPSDHHASLRSLPAIFHCPFISKSAALSLNLTRLHQGHQRLCFSVTPNAFFSPALLGFTLRQLVRACRLAVGSGFPRGESSLLALLRSLSSQPLLHRAAVPELHQARAPPAALAPPSGALAPSPQPSSFSQCQSFFRFTSPLIWESCLSPASPRLLLALTLRQQLPN